MDGFWCLKYLYYFHVSVKELSCKRERITFLSSASRFQQVCVHPPFRSCLTDAVGVFVTHSRNPQIYVTRLTFCGK